MFRVTIHYDKKQEQAAKLLLHTIGIDAYDPELYGSVYELGLYRYDAAVDELYHALKLGTIIFFSIERYEENHQ